jgi:glycosyltransferase involved in cell wall biosynthesis
VSEQLPLVSIVTPTLNQAGYLEAAIQSVLNQDYPRVEYLVIDGGSTDGSMEIIRRYSGRLAYWSSAPDSGQTEAINTGLGRARGEILAWLNSDDVYYPGAVAEAVAFLQAHPELGMVYGDADYIDDAGKVVGRFPARPTDLARLRRGFVHIPQQASFFRASLWRMVGPLDPTFYFAMDYDLWVRIASVARLRYHPRTWAGFRLHRGAKTQVAADRCWPEMLRVHRRDGGSDLSLLYAKYLLRRVLEPLLPYRLKARLWLHEVGSRWRARTG